MLERVTEGFKEGSAPSSMSPAGGNPCVVLRRKHSNGISPSVLTDVGSKALEKGENSVKEKPRVRKESSVPKQDGITMRSLIIRRIPFAKSVRCEMTKTTLARCKVKPWQRVNVITADHQILSVENESRRGRAHMF